MYNRSENEVNHFYFNSNVNSIMAHITTTPHPGVRLQKFKFSVQFSKVKLS